MFNCWYILSDWEQQFLSLVCYEYIPSYLIVSLNQYTADLLSLMLLCMYSCIAALDHPHKYWYCISVYWMFPINRYIIDISLIWYFKARPCHKTIKVFLLPKSICICHKFTNPLLLINWNWTCTNFSISSSLEEKLITTSSFDIYSHLIVVLIVDPYFYILLEIFHILKFFFHRFLNMIILQSKMI